MVFNYLQYNKKNKKKRYFCKNYFNYKISFHKNMAEQLVESKLNLKEQDLKYYQQILENINDIVWIIDVSTEMYKYMVGAVRKITQFESEDYLKMSLKDSLPPHSYKIVSERLKVETENFLLRGAKYDPGVNFDIEIYRKDHSLVWIETSSRVILNEENNSLEILGTTRLIEERKKLELELKQSKEWHSLITNNIADIMSVMDANTLKYEYVEGNTFEILGFTNEEYIGKFLHDIVPPDCLKYISDVIVKSLRDYYRGTSKTIESYLYFQQYHKDGSLIPMESAAKMTFNDDNTPRHIISIKRRGISKFV